MMFAGQAVLGRVNEHAPYNAAQRLLDQKVVSDHIFWHRTLSHTTKKWRLLLPGASGPRLTLLGARALISVPAPHYAARATGA